MEQREIKFRLRIGNEIVGYERIQPNEDGYLISTYSFDNLTGKGIFGGWIYKQMEHKEKDQYTGLKDKNGKEIYEGDIVKYTKHNGYLVDDFISEVFWEDVQWSIGDEELGRVDELKYDILNHLEVIGNICENKDLLK